MNNQNPQECHTRFLSAGMALAFLLWAFTLVEGVTLILLVAFARGVWR